MSTDRANGNIGSIQMLRGIAALMVVFFHCGEALQRMGQPSPLFKWMDTGVDIFFVISGFIMWVTTDKAPDRTAGAFLLNRIVRIAPLYWIVTIGMVLVLLVAPGVTQSARFDPMHILASLFFIARLNSGTMEYQPVVVPGWTLNMEMYFYLLFAIAIWLSAGSRVARIAIVGVLIAASALAPLLFPGLPGAILFYCQPIIWEFLFGIGLGWLYLRRPLNLGATGWVIAAAGFCVLAFNEALRTIVPHVLSAGVPALLIVGGALFASRFSSRPLEWLGDQSYSLYLTHSIALSAISQMWRAAGLLGTSPLLFVMIASSLCVVVGALVYRFVEKPIGRIGRPSRRRSDPSGGGASLAKVPQ